MKPTRPFHQTPVITIDGPTASGKGTVAALVAATLGFHLLDSDALYRLTALASVRYNIEPEDGDALAALVARTPACSALSIPSISTRMSCMASSITATLRSSEFPPVLIDSSLNQLTIKVIAPDHNPDRDRPNHALVPDRA